MRRNFAAVLGIVSVGCALGWLSHKLDTTNDAASPRSTVNVGAPEQATRGSLSLLRPALRDPPVRARSADDIASAGETAELPPLDCSAPRGDVLRIEALAVSAAAFCQELSALAGPPPATTTEGWRKQARHLRERLIDTELVRIALAQEGIVVEESAVEQAMAQARRPDSDAQPSDAEEAQLRAQVRARLERSRLLEARTSAAVTDEDLRAAYARDPARYGEPARATVTPFALRLSPSASDADIAQARQKAQQFRSEGAQGDAVAAGVRIGLAALPAFEVEDGGIEPALAAVALRLGSGQWSEPVRARIGWVVMRVDEVRAAAVLPFEEVQGKVKAMRIGERRRDDEAALRRDLRDDARIEDLVSF